MYVVLFSPRRLSRRFSQNRVRLCLSKMLIFLHTDSCICTVLRRFVGHRPRKWLSGLTLWLPLYHLKTTNKSVKFEILKRFRFGNSVRKDPHQKAQYLKCYRTGKYTACGVCVHFAPRKFHRLGQWTALFSSLSIFQTKKAQSLSALYVVKFSVGFRGLRRKALWYSPFCVAYTSVCGVYFLLSYSVRRQHHEDSDTF